MLNLLALNALVELANCQECVRRHPLRR